MRRPVPWSLIAFVFLIVGAAVLVGVSIKHEIKRRCYTVNVIQSAATVQYEMCCHRTVLHFGGVTKVCGSEYPTARTIVVKVPEDSENEEKF